MLRRSFSALAINNITVFGSGTMGGGIAQVSAAAGVNVTLVDVKEDVLAKNKDVIAKSLGRIIKKEVEKKGGNVNDVPKAVDEIMSRITTTVDAQAAVKNTDLVVEAIVENLAVKQKLWTGINDAAPASCIFASNTSSLSIDDQAAVVPSRRANFAGLHFFSPVAMMKLVEVVKGADTSKQTLDDLFDYSKRIGKVPILCKDTKGFVVNRLLVPYMLEAFRLVERDVASVEDVDIAMRLGAGHPQGPFQLADSVGLDIVYNISHAWHKTDPENPIFVPSKLIDQKIAEGKLGVKNGKGFYNWGK
jgi:3-hydroxyacyl-CoA dehydrogenase